jgi:hypothetical protein
VVVTCLALGAALILSCILKTWVSIPSAFDWYLLAMGVVLSSISLFTRFAVTPTRLEAEMRSLIAMLDQATPARE